MTAGFLKERFGFDVEKDTNFMYAKVKSVQIFLLFLSSLPKSDFFGICTSVKHFPFESVGSRLVQLHDVTKASAVHI